MTAPQILPMAKNAGGVEQKSANLLALLGRDPLQPQGGMVQTEPTLSSFELIWEETYPVKLQGGY